MENCFETLVGITNTGGCNCDQNRPDGTDTVQRWYYEVFHADADPDDTLVFAAQYKLPAGEALVELSGGSLGAALRLSGGEGITLAQEAAKLIDRALNLFDG